MSWIKKEPIPAKGTAQMLCKQPAQGRTIKIAHRREDCNYSTGAWSLAQHLLSYYREKFTFQSNYPENVQSDPFYELVVQCRQRGLDPMDTIGRLIDAAATSSKADLTPFQFGFKALEILDRIEAKQEVGHE